MRIVWLEDSHLIPLRGHGVEFRLGEPAESAQLVAVVSGFEWLHGNPETVEVHIRTASDAGDASMLEHARITIQHYLLSKKPFDGRVASGLHVHING